MYSCSGSHGYWNVQLDSSSAGPPAGFAKYKGSRNWWGNIIPWIYIFSSSDYALYSLISFFKFNDVFVCCRFDIYRAVLRMSGCSEIYIFHSRCRQVVLRCEGSCQRFTPRVGSLSNCEQFAPIPSASSSPHLDATLTVMALMILTSSFNEIQSKPTLTKSFSRTSSWNNWFLGFPLTGHPHVQAEDVRDGSGGFWRPVALHNAEHNEWHPFQMA